MQDQQGNPFGASPYPTGNNPYYQQQPTPQLQQQQMPPQMGNPFDPMAGQVPSPQNHGSPFGVKPPESDNPFGMSSPPPPHQQQQQPPQNYSPYGGPPPPQGQSTALVPSQHQSNPYALPQAGNSFGGTPQGGGANAGSGNPFDPFAPPPPPAPAPPPPAPVPQQQPFENASHASHPFVDQSSQQQHHIHDTQSLPPYPQPPPSYPQPPPPEPQAAPPSPKPRPDPPAPLQHHHHGHGPPPRGEADIYDMDSPGSQSVESRNKYAEELAQNAPPGSSPLPKAALVRKKGFVLSRISFRTIVMKKWKQAFWVQYGPHTMLWFRSQADFDDWLNNPYHNQAQRNFLIKLAVNFVHDLYKPSVRGYQVTQCRTKAYGNKMIRQFKLERWMDYGPTIAAAFGSYNPKEVDDLREALVECMRNTPLSGGIRATGAVRQNHPTENRPFSYDNHRQNEENGYNRGGYPKDGNYEETPPPPADQPSPQGNDSVAEEADLLDMDNWDDVPGHGAPLPQGGPPHPGASPYHQGPPPGASPYQQGPTPQQSPYQQGPPPGASPFHQGPPGSFVGGYPPQQQQPQQQPDFAGALVPVQPVAPAPYPGAPPPYGSPYGAPPPQQQGGWPGQSPPPPQQQQHPPYGQAPAYPQPGF